MWSKYSKIIRFFFTLGSAFLAINSLAWAGPRHYCFSRHTQEGIQSNNHRTLPYAKATHGQSLEISAALIAFETGVYVPASILDAQAYQAQTHGIPLMCDELVSMSTTPAFTAQASIPKGPVPEITDLELESIINELKARYWEKGFPSLSESLASQLVKLNQQPNYFCLTRHLIESMLRASNLAPIQSGRSQALGFERTENISWGFIESHLVGLPLAIKIDRMAISLQRKGIPILCNDVPPIPAS